MKIKDKLLFAFGIYILLSALFGLLIYKELRLITTKMSLVETADDITSALLEVRRYEKNFLLFRDKENLDVLNKYVDVFKKDVSNIGAEIIAEMGPNDYYLIKKRMGEYESMLIRLTENFKSQDELITIIRSTGRTGEKMLSGADLDKFLVVRRHEKNLMLYKDEAAYRILTGQMHTLSPASLEKTGRYMILIGKLFDLYNSERTDSENMRLRAREIQTVTENLSTRERKDINQILQRATALLLFGFMALVVLGTFISLKLGFGIVEPIRELERVTKKLAGGDFSETLEIKGRDEISSLAVSFNQMENRLQDTLSALENTINELRKKQAELVEAEKLGSMGKLAAGIAHEINNPLTSILTFSNLILEKLPPGDPNREKVSIMARETFKARTIVRQLLSFARETPMKKELICVNQPIQEIIDSLRAQDAFKGITLYADFGENIPEINADPVQIGQAVLNLLLNAIHSITVPGEIVIRTTKNGKFVEISVSDTGSGISEENMGHIFDPFFTTKDSVKGTGLGLAVTYGIIKKHGGEIDVSSVLGKGSIFTLKLPING